MSSQPRDIVCQCGAQLAYLLRPALNEPTVNGLETPRCCCCIWDRQSGCVSVHACMCVYSLVPMSRSSLLPSRGDGKVFFSLEKLDESLVFPAFWLRNNYPRIDHLFSSQSGRNGGTVLVNLCSVNISYQLKKSTSHH